MRGLTTFLKRFRRARRGATAVEFAFVGLPFVALIAASLEIGTMFLVQSTLDGATDEASRRIRTGELQAGGGSAATFKAAVCAEMTFLGSSCSSNLSVDVRRYTSFAGQNPPNPIKNGAVNSAEMTFTPGAGRDIILVRTFYQWTLFSPLMNVGVSNLSGNKRLITSAFSFRNEPF